MGYQNFPEIFNITQKFQIKWNFQRKQNFSTSYMPSHPIFFSYVLYITSAHRLCQYKAFAIYTENSKFIFYLFSSFSIPFTSFSSFTHITEARYDTLKRKVVISTMALFRIAIKCEMMRKRRKKYKNNNKMLLEN